MYLILPIIVVILLIVYLYKNCNCIDKKSCNCKIKKILIALIISIPVLYYLFKTEEIKATMVSRKSDFPKKIIDENDINNIQNLTKKCENIVKAKGYTDKILNIETI